MKAIVLAFAIGWIATAEGVKAQQNSDKMGTDPAACAKYQSLYQDFYQQGNYKEAMPWWNRALQTCPRYSKNLYIHGVKMFEDKISRENDARRKDILIDSLLWVYDTRIANFGDDPRSPKGYILGLKGIAIQKFRKEDYPKSYKILGESISLMGSQSSAAVVLTYMQASRQLFRTGAISGEKTLADYEMVTKIIDANLLINPEDDGFRLTRDQVDVYLASSGAASCEALTKQYTARFEGSKNDISWLKQVTGQLKKAGCTNTGIFSQAAEALFRLEPTAAGAHDLATVLIDLHEFAKAADYLQKAVDLTAKNEDRAVLYYELSDLYSSRLKNYQKARTLALKAIESRPNWGKPYLLTGQIYYAARQDLFRDPWDQATVLWAAVDKLIKAKSVDPDISDEANKLINSYSDSFPNNETIILRKLHDGESYTIGGWIHETTKVRSKKL